MYAAFFLVAPANDWFLGFDELHHRTAVWSAVMSGVSVLRATGHGISSVTDGAGRVLARQSSREGPVVLVVDMPYAGQFAMQRSAQSSARQSVELSCGAPVED